MASKVRISLPPRLIEDARAAQYANRQRLSARTLETKLRNKIQKRINLAEESRLSSEKLIGGTLEFREKNQYKIRTKRRSFRRGFLLVPDRDYDSEGRLYVRSEDGAVQYATSVDPYDNTPTDFRPFEFTQGKLLAKPYTYGGSTQGQGYESAIKHTTGKLDETSQSFTLEYFVTLEAGPPLIPSTVAVGGSNYKVTSYSCSFGLDLTQIDSAAEVTFLQVILSKQRAYSTSSPVSPFTKQVTGLRESWGLVQNVFNNTQDIILTTGGGEYHVAICITQSTGKIYFDGSFVRQFEFNSTLSSGSRIKSRFYLQSLKQEAVYTELDPNNPISVTLFPVTPRSGFRCYRFTPGQALYQGTSFTPPANITDLA